MRRRGLLAAAALLPTTARAQGSGQGPGQGASRIACIGSALTEIVCALGAGARLIAVDSSSLFPPAIRQVPKLGYYRALPTEGLIGMSPDLLLLSDEAGPAEAVAVLRAAGMRITTIRDGAGPGAAEAKARAVSAALGLDAAPLAEAIAADRALLDASLAAVARRPRVLFILSLARGVPLVSGRDTHADAVIADAGGVNCVTSWAGYRPLSAEGALGLAPDAILLMDHALAEAGGVEGVLAVPSLALTPAGRGRRVIGMDGPYLLNFGPRSAHARRDLAVQLHPGLSLPTLPERPWTAL
jgi:iron complex transport system substrate-binding protein